VAAASGQRERPTRRRRDAVLRRRPEQGTMRVTPPPRPKLACRSGCGACCIAPSIASPIPRMPQGKPDVN